MILKPLGARLQKTFPFQAIDH